VSRTPIFFNWVRLRKIIPIRGSALGARAKLGSFGKFLLTPPKLNYAQTCTNRLRSDNYFADCAGQLANRMSHRPSSAAIFIFLGQGFRSKTLREQARFILSSWPNQKNRLTAQFCTIRSLATPQTPQTPPDHPEWVRFAKSSPGSAARKPATSLSRPDLPRIRFSRKWSPRGPAGICNL